MGANLGRDFNDFGQKKPKSAIYQRIYYIFVAYYPLDL